jgi:hypothetical protein
VGVGDKDLVASQLQSASRSAHSSRCRPLLGAAFTPTHAALVVASEAGQDLRRKVSGERRPEGRAVRPRSRPPVPFDRPRNATPHVILAISLPLMH